MSARVSEEKESQVLELIEKEHYAAEIARLTGVAHGTVKAVASRNGKTIARPRKQTPEERREVQLRWQQNNRKKMQEYRRKNYYKYHEENRERHARYYHKDIEKSRAYSRKKNKEYRSKHPDRFKAYHKKGYLKNRAKIKEYTKNYYHNKKAAIPYAAVRSEKDMQKEIVRRCKAGEAGEFGERIYANGNGQTLTSKELGCRPGKADLAIEGDRFFYRLELKTPIGKISKEQQEEHVRLNNRPLYHHEFARSVDEAMTIICRWAGLDLDPEVLTMGTEDTTV